VEEEVSKSKRSQVGKEENNVPTVHVNKHAWEPPITSKHFWHVHEIEHLKHKMLHFFDDATHGFHNNKKDLLRNSHTVCL